MNETVYMTDSEDENLQERKRRSRGKAKSWMKVKEFEDATQAESHVENEGIWKKSSKKRSLEGEKIAYRCIYGNYRKRECPASIYLLYHAKNMKVSLYSTEEKHNHNKTLLPSRGLDDNSKKFIIGLFKQGIQKPNAVLAAFRNEYLLEPPKAQLINFLRTLREENESVGISESDLKDWCVSKEIIPEDMDLLFVLDYNFEDDVKIVLSTKRLLENVEKSNLIQIDTRYKLIWHNYSVVLLGSSDQDLVFHPFAVAIYEKENSENFSFIFNALLKYNKNWNPSILLADGNEDITSGFEKTFGKHPEIRLICYSYLVQVIDKKLKSLDNAFDIKNDINLIHHCASSDVFKRVSKLFLEKWNINKKTNGFIKYFEEDWIKNNQNWYEGVAIGYPSTNSGIENLNLSIKKLHTIREKLPLEQFLTNLENLLSKWSKERHPLSPEYKAFNKKTNINFKDWTEAYQWTKLNLKLEQLNTKYYMYASNFEHSNLKKLISQLNIDKWDNFDEFKEIYFRICVVETKDDVFSCTCAAYLKNYKCKHALGLKIRLGKIHVPSGVVNVNLGEKRKRGRPAKARKAILI